jgi:AAA domain, putative AbiEii toxin, Type IV TA system
VRIERVMVHGRLRALHDRDDRFVGPNGKVHEAVCLRGLNGTGKSTYLEMLAQLWLWFRNSAVQGRYVTATSNTALLREVSMGAGSFVAARFTDLPGPQSQMWIAYGPRKAIEKALARDPDDPSRLTEGWGSVAEEATLRFWREAFGRAESGIDPAQDVPLMIAIEAENKSVPELRKNELTKPGSAPAYVPVARYLPAARGPSHLEGMMRTLFLARPDRWRLLAQYVGDLRPGLLLDDRFDEATQRPRFRLDTGKGSETLTLDKLSAGERSLLINLCLILRWTRPGSIVLLDEPELHQHLSLMGGKLAVIETLVAENGGQLFAASHAPEVWNHFRRPGALIDLDGGG